MQPTYFSSVMRHCRGRFLARLSACLLLCCLAAAAGGCLPDFGQAEEEKKFVTDIELAEQALKDRDTSEAEMHFERYLRKNPAGDRRWEVWEQLLSIAHNVRQDKETTKEYLEIMLQEFSSDAPRRRRIAVGLAGLYNETRDYNKAISMWEELTADKELPDEERAAVYRLLSQAYMRRLEFTMATDTLELCLKLPVGGSTKADCLYSLAEVRMLTDDLKGSESALNDLMGIEESTAEQRVLATFMLADVLEQQMRNQEALEHFEAIRDSYPNSKVIEVRLLNLKNKLDKKPDVVPKYRNMKGQ